MTTGGDILIKVGADTSGFQAGMGAVESRMNGVARSVGRYGMMIGAGLGVLTGLAVKLAGDYQKSLNIFQAVTKATVPQMEAVDAKAKALGADLSLPATSAKDAADAMTELAKGGLSVNQTMAAAKGVLQMSAAAEISNAEAAKITARALKAFNLEGSEAGRVADVLANAANASTGEMTDFAMGLQQSSAVAKMYGLSINENTAALMKMADAGISGSDAGTSFKRLLQTLIPVTDRQQELTKKLGINVFDANGKFAGIRGAIKQYHAALAPLSQQQRLTAMNTLFGSDAIRAANIVLMDGVSSFDQYVARTEVSGAAADLAAAKMKGFKGALEGFKSAAETAAIGVGTKLLPALTQLVGSLSSVVNWLDRHKTVAMALFVATSSLATGMVTFSAGTRVATMALQIFAAASGQAAATAGALGIAMKATGIGAIVGLAGMAAGALLSLKLATGGTRDATAQLTQTIRDYRTALDDARQAESALANGALNLKDAQLSLKEAVANRIRVDKDTTSTALERRRADLQVEQAEQRVKDAQDQVVDSAKKVAVSHQKASTELINMRGRTIELAEKLEKIVRAGGDSDKAMSLFKTTLKQMAAEAGGSSTAAGRAAGDILKLAKSMKGIPTEKDLKASGIFKSISQEAKKEGDKTTKVLDDVGPRAKTSAHGIGSSIKGGVVEGTGGLGAALAARITREINAALAQAKADQGAKSPAVKWVNELGKPLGEGVVEGFLMGSANLPSNVTDRVRNALERAQSVVQSMQSRVTSAFETVAEKAMRAFEAKTAKMLANLRVTVSTSLGSFSYAEGDLTPAEKQLAAERAARDEAARQRELAAAIESGDLQRIADAQWAIREANLMKQAEQERAAATSQLENARLELQSRRDLEKEHLEKQLAQLQDYLAKHPGQYKKVHKKLMKLFKDEFGPGFKLAGENLGKAFARGLGESFDALSKAAKKFAQILEDYLKVASPAKTGPLSQINTWWKALPDTLLSGVDMSKTGAYIAGGVDASLSVAPRSIGHGVGSGGAVYVTNISVPLSNVYGDIDKAALELRSRLQRMVNTGQIPNVGLT